MSSIDPRETKYDLYKKWILNIKAKGKAWSDITFACKGDEQGLKTFLKNKADEDMWDPITVEEWMAVVDYIQQINAGHGQNLLKLPTIYEARFGQAKKHL